MTKLVHKATFLTLSDVLVHSDKQLVPSEPISLYRYVELLVQLAIIRKKRFNAVMETGPGTYPVFAAWPREAYGTATIVDYNPDVVDFCRKLLPDADFIEADFEQTGVLTGLNRKWDLVVSNGVLEHIKNDAAHIEDIRQSLSDEGMVVCVTVLHDWLFNDWDRAVGHYRRYSLKSLLELFGNFSEIQIIQTSLLQELARPLFFGRIRHLVNASPEENNRRFGAEVAKFSKPPYASIFGLVRWILPLYLCLDWWLSRFGGGIVIIIAKK